MNTVFCLALFDALNMWNKSGSYFNITSVEALFTGVKCPNYNCAPAVNNIAYTVSGFEFTRQIFHFLCKTVFCVYYLKQIFISILNQNDTENNIQYMDKI